MFILLHLLKYFCSPKCGLSCWMFYVCLRRMCIMMLLDESFYINKIQLIDGAFQFNHIITDFLPQTLQWYKI